MQVTFSNLFKQLKRRLRQKKRWLTLGAYFLLAGGIAAAALWMTRGYETESAVKDTAPALSPAIAGPESAEETKKALESIENRKGKQEVVLHRRYICGEETEELGSMEASEVFNLYREHPEAQVSIDESGIVHVVEQVDDLAPECRENAYFGLDKNGNLSLFDGAPEQDRVIRTFFQLDVQHMKSSLPEDVVNQLYSGIRVSDLDDYNSVLSTFSQYASTYAEPAAKTGS